MNNNMNCILRDKRVFVDVGDVINTLSDFQDMASGMIKTLDDDNPLIKELLIKEIGYAGNHSLLHKNEEEYKLEMIRNLASSIRYDLRKQRKR